MITKSAITLVIILSLGQCSSPEDETADEIPAVACTCDTNQTLQTIKAVSFNRIVQYDTAAFPADSFYTLSGSVNRRLWFRDVENPFPTKFTKYWNDYAWSNYHADHIDFVNYYDSIPGVEIAFQFGPNMDLWAYHIFVVKKVNCCYLVTRSYFRHARFTYKAYSIIDSLKLDSLYQVLQPINKLPVDTVAEWNYSGYFSDNRHHTKFYIDFEKEVQGEKKEAKPEVAKLYDFVDHRIKWTVTYGK